MLNSDDKTVREVARGSLFLDMRQLEVLAQQNQPGFLSLQTKSKAMAERTQTLLAVWGFSQTDLTSVTSTEQLKFFPRLE